MIYAISDLHGQYKLWTKVKQFLHSDDKLICLGDNIDRGPDGIKIYQEQKEIGAIILKGNHEDMAAAAIPVLCEGKYNSMVKLWFENGGMATWESINEDKELALQIVTEFQNLPTNITYTFEHYSVVCDHCGFTPNSPYQKFWDREHFHDKWDDDYYDQGIYIVHGHTPVQYLIDNLGLPRTKELKIARYADCHKIDIDLGCFASHKTALLNLKTLIPTYFKEVI